MTALFSMIATLQVFAEPMTLRPLTNTISTTWTPLMKVYRDAFTRDDIYSAAATSVIIAVATFVLSFGFLRLVQRPRLRPGGLSHDHRPTSPCRPGARARRGIR